MDQPQTSGDFLTDVKIFAETYLCWSSSQEIDGNVVFHMLLANVLTNSWS